MILYEKEVCAYAGLPSIPKKEWDGNSSFSKGVAVISLLSGLKAYAIASFSPQKESVPRIMKVFTGEPFSDIEKIYVVPEYMETDLSNADLDAESKKKAEALVEEAKEIENEDIEEEIKDNGNPYFFDFIHNDDEAIAYIEAYNKRNKIKGKVPRNHDTILMRLAVIYSEANKQNK